MKYRACIPSARFDPFERRLFEDGRPTGREVNEASWASSDRWEKGKGGQGTRRKGRERKEGGTGIRGTKEEAATRIPGVHRLPALG